MKGLLQVLDAIARVTTEAGDDLAALLIGARLARPYDGGTRQGWCDGR